MGMISQKLRESAEGQRCMFEIPGVCNRDPATTILCHIHDEAKGMANKANDWSAAFGCSSCHAAIDQHRLPKEDELFFSLRAMQRTHVHWVREGLMSFDITKSRPKQSSKILPRRPLGTGEIAP